MTDGLGDANTEAEGSDNAPGAVLAEMILGLEALRRQFREVRDRELRERLYAELALVAHEVGRLRGRTVTSVSSRSEDSVPPPRVREAA